MAFLFAFLVPQMVNILDSLSGAFELFYESGTVNIAFFAIAVLVFGKYEIDRVNVTEGVGKAISSLSKYTFGVYLVHALILSLIWELIPCDITTINAIMGII